MISNSCGSTLALASYMSSSSSQNSICSTRSSSSFSCKLFACFSKSSLCLSAFDCFPLQGVSPGVVPPTGLPDIYSTKSNMGESTPRELMRILSFGSRGGNQTPSFLSKRYVCWKPGYLSSSIMKVSAQSWISDKTCVSTFSQLYFFSFDSSFFAKRPDFPLF